MRGREGTDIMVGRLEVWTATPTLVAEEVDITAATLWPLLLLLLGLGEIVVLEAIGKVDITATTLVSSCPVTI